jgi:hypothetical protein
MGLRFYIEPSMPEGGTAGEPCFRGVFPATFSMLFVCAGVPRSSWQASASSENHQK